MGHLGDDAVHKISHELKKKLVKSAEKFGIGYCKVLYTTKCKRIDVMLSSVPLKRYLKGSNQNLACFCSILKLSTPF